MAYLDTSAVLRLVDGVGDPGPVRDALGEQPISSELLEIEMHVAAHRRIHSGVVPPEQRIALLAAMAAVSRPVALQRLSPQVLATTRIVAAAHPLRTLDALHLATAQLAGAELASRRRRLRFITADREQAQAAEALFPSQVTLLAG